MAIRICDPMLHTAGQLFASDHNAENNGQLDLTFTTRHEHPIRQRVVLYIPNPLERAKLLAAFPGGQFDPTADDALPPIFGTEHVRIEWSDLGVRLHLNGDELTVTFFRVKMSSEVAA